MSHWASRPVNMAPLIFDSVGLLQKRTTSTLACVSASSMPIAPCIAGAIKYAMDDPSGRL